MKSEYVQVFETIDISLIVLDRDMFVTGWNHWMEQHSGIPPRDVCADQQKAENSDHQEATL